jgi:hypothetical protein
VGFFGDGATYHGFVGSVTDYEQIDYPGAARTFIDGMNNAGVLVGNAHVGDLSVAFVVTQDSDPATLLMELATDVSGVGPGKSFANMIRLAQVYHEASDVQATCAVLANFLREVKAQRGKRNLAAHQADDFTDQVMTIMDEIGCRE